MRSVGGTRSGAPSGGMRAAPRRVAGALRGHDDGDRARESGLVDRLLVRPLPRFGEGERFEVSQCLAPAPGEAGPIEPDFAGRDRGVGRPSPAPLHLPAVDGRDRDPDPLGDRGLRPGRALDQHPHPLDDIRNVMPPTLAAPKMRSRRRHVVGRKRRNTMTHPRNINWIFTDASALVVTERSVVRRIGPATGSGTLVLPGGPAHLHGGGRPAAGGDPPHAAVINWRRAAPLQPGRGRLD